MRNSSITDAGAAVKMVWTLIKKEEAESYLDSFITESQIIDRNNSALRTDIRKSGDSYGSVDFCFFRALLRNTFYRNPYLHVHFREYSEIQYFRLQ